LRAESEVKQLTGEMTDEEHHLYKEMNHCFLKLLQSLNAFNFCKYNFRMVRDNTQDEILRTSKLIKYEVLEMADLMETLTQMVIT